MRFKTILAASIGAAALALMAFMGGGGGTTAAADTPIGLSDVLYTEVSESLTMRVLDNHLTKGPYAPDTVVITEAGSVVATYEEIRLGEPPDEFRFYLDGDLDNRVAKSTPFQTAVPPQPELIGMTYKITVEFELGKPLVVIEPGRQIWYWGQYLGEGPFPPGGWHTQAKYQSVPPDAFGPDLYGCDVLIKNPDAPLTCGEKGWTPPTLEE